MLKYVNVKTKKKIKCIVHWKFLKIMKISYLKKKKKAKKLATYM